MTLNNKNIIPLLNELLKSYSIDFSSQSRKELEILFKDSRNVEATKERYCNLIYSEEKSENNNPIKNKIISQYFKVRIKDLKILSIKEFKHYCELNNIELKDKKYSDKYEASQQNTSNIRNRILEKIVGSKVTESSNQVSVPIEQSETFYREFKNENHIDWGWYGLSSEENFDWKQEILEDGKYKWDWEALFVNPSIMWSFDLIDKFKEVVNWAYISSMELEWTAKEIDHFKDYLVFNGEYKSGLESANGKNHGTETFQRYSMKHNIIGNISANTYIRWNDTLIEDFKEFWNWDLLSKNESVRWNQKRIKKFKNYINFKSLSKNHSFDWNEEFINDHIELLCINSLVSNQSIIWSPNLISKHFDKIDIVHLSKIGNITKDAIIAFSTVWSKTDTQSHYVRGGSNGSYYYYTQHSLWEYLCENKNIIWSENLLSKYLDILPLKNLCSERIVVSIEFINKNWNYYRNEMTSYWENYYGEEKETYHDIYLREKIKDCLIIDLDYENFLENELRWWGVLCSEMFLNKSIKNIIIKALNTPC